MDSGKTNNCTNSKLKTFHILIKIMNDLCRTCGKCCYDTEMLLTNEDIVRISKKFNHQALSTFFFINNDGFKQLANVDGHCIFFNPIDVSCQIYSIRPEGCILYPLVYNEKNQKCEVDTFCPHKKTFYQEQKEFKFSCFRILKLINKLYEELNLV